VKSLLLHTRGPVLLLSATLQQNRIQDLEDLGVHLYRGGGSTAKPTYRFRLVDEATAKAAVLQHRAAKHQIPPSEPDGAVVEHQGRVLLVSNTVDRCQQRGEIFGADVIYHSRFKRCDRAVQHEATLKRLRTEGTVAATQVCEMSLDVSASMMVTDLCDIPGLIQRAGRVNRYGEYAQGAEILVVIPGDSKPYEDKAMEAALELVQSIDNQLVDQEELAARMQRFLPAARSAEQWGQLYESGYWAIARDFRDIDDYTVQTLLDKDLQQAIELVSDRSTRHRLQNLLCPAPLWWVRMQRGVSARDRHADLPPWVWVVPADHYRADRGLRVR
jgi:CRISPR-associated endonuclease/helicase Cas3